MHTILKVTKLNYFLRNIKHFLVYEFMEKYYHTEYRILSCIEKSRSALQIFFHFEETGMGGWGLIQGRTIFEKHKIFVVLVFIYNIPCYIVSVPVHYFENTCVNYNYFAIRNL